MYELISISVFFSVSAFIVNIFVLLHVYDALSKVKDMETYIYRNREKV